MASVNENIAKAMDVLIRQRLGSLAMDQTIIAEITEVVNSAKGHYKIRYQNVIVDVYSENTDKIYKNGDTVQVKVPNGDFSAKKIIEGKASSNASLLESQIQSLKNYLIPVSPAIKINFNDVKEMGLIAGVSRSLKINSFTYDTQNFSILSNLYDIVQIEANFRTAFSSEHQKGNYGIKIKCKISDNDNVEYILDTSNFRGNFYNYNSGAIQTLRLQIPKGTLKEIESIIFFEEMEQDGANGDKANIFVENINVSFFDSIDFTEYEYYLYVNALQGYEFTENTSLLQFQPKCLHKGKEITGETGYQIYWYKKSAPMEGKTYAGSNWTLIETKDRADNEYLDNNLLCVNKINNISNNEYKVIFKDDEDLFLEKEFTVYNTQNDLPKIIQKTNLQEKTTSLFLESNPNNYTTIWESNGQKIAKDKDSEGKDIEQITIKNSDFTSKFLEIICYFYPQKARGEQICIGSVKYLLAPVEEDKDIDVAFEGIEFYQYDANGDIFLEDAMREKLLRVQIQAKEGYAAQIADTSFSIGDKIITNSAVDPADSMLQQVWIDNENNIHYKISSTYSLSKTNNTIKVTINLINGKILSFSKDIIFSKVGDLGTNNSNYTMILEPVGDLIVYDTFDEDYVIKIKIYYQGKEVKLSKEQIELKEIDISGTKVNITDKEFNDIFNEKGEYKISTSFLHPIKTIVPYDYNKYNVLDEIISLKMANGLLEFYQAKQSINKNSQLTDENGKIIQEHLQYWTKWEDEISLFGGNYISVTIKINNNILTSQLIIPCSTQDGSNKEKNNIYLAELMLPQTIRYSSAGDRPRYYNKNENKENKISKEVFTPFSLQPDYYFDFNKVSDNNKYYVGGIIQITVPTTQDIIYWPLIYYLNSYGNNAINNWDGEEIIVEKGNILANQIIGGRKNKETNEFSGVAIGEVEDNENKYSGIYGYSEGINTFGLRSDGTAYFGRGGGIQIKGDEAKIYGRGFDNDAIMILNLTSASNDKAIKVGDAFWVDYSGNAYLSGEIRAMKGNIGGWSIDNDGLQAYRIWEGSDKETVIRLHPDNVQLPEVCIYHSGYGEKSRGYLGFQFGNNAQPVLSLRTSINGIYLNPHYKEINENGYIRFSSGAIGFDRGKEGSAQDMAKHIYLGQGLDKKTLHDYIDGMITTAINKLPTGGGSQE